MLVQAVDVDWSAKKTTARGAKVQVTCPVHKSPRWIAPKLAWKQTRAGLFTGACSKDRLNVSSRAFPEAPGADWTDYEMVQEAPERVAE